MLQHQNYYNYESVLERNCILQVQNPNLMETMVATDNAGGELRSSKIRLLLGSKSLKVQKQKQKSEEAAVKHAISEQRRRRRINSHLQRLRKILLPKATSKTVKALILTETVRQVTELKQRAASVVLQHDGKGWCGDDSTSGSFMFPGESDEATVNYCKGSEGKMVKAIICCESRSSMNRDLTKAIRLVGARVVRAEMATIGGRTKAEVVVQWREEGGGGEEDVGSLRRALNALVESRASGCSDLGRLMTANGHTGWGLEIPTNKRARICGFAGHY